MIDNDISNISDELHDRGMDAHYDAICSHLPSIHDAAQTLHDAIYATMTPIADIFCQTADNADDLPYDLDSDEFACCAASHALISAFGYNFYTADC